MPVNDPIKGRKVAPDALAFEPRLLGGGAASITYQAGQTIVNEATAAEPQDLTNSQERQGENLVRSAFDGEVRAKQFVGDWHAAFDWDIDSDVDITNNTFTALDFDHEVIRCDGTYNRGGVWFFRVPENYAGVWWLHARIQIQIPALATVSRAQLGFSLVNPGSLVTLVDEHNAAWSGTTPTLNALLSGGRHVRLRGGDLVICVLRFFGAAGSATYIHPSSVVGYVGGHRVSCDTEQRDTPDNQLSFTFGA
jgi:hypothetical protein